MLNKTLYELMTKRKPELIYFKPFGCKCYLKMARMILESLIQKVTKEFLLGTPQTSNLTKSTIKEPSV